MEQRKQHTMSMRSTYEMICRKALEEGRYQFNVSDPSLNLISFACGRGEGYEADEDKKQAEYWISTRKPLDPNNKGTFKMIIDHDDIGEEERNDWASKYGIYDYHLSYFPRAWMADAFPDLYPEKIVKPEPVKPVSTSGPESLMEFALRNGCDFMDLSTGEIYRAL